MPDRDPSGDPGDTGPRNAKAEAKAAKAYAKAERPWYKKKRWWLAGFILLIVVISVASGGGSDDKSSDSASNNDAPAASDSDSSAKEETTKEESCGTEASDDCTPRVGPDGTVRVDALNWKITGAETAPTVGDQQFGAGETANGVYLIVDLSVKSDKDESATINSDIVSLEVDGNTYDVDTDGSTAVELSGGKTFFLNDVGPDSTLSGTVVFDVPPEVLKKKPELVFHELGLGETKGYIAVPPV